MSKKTKKKSSILNRVQITQKSQERKEKFDAWIDTLPEFKFKPKTWEFWRDSILIFFVGSLLGHILEVILWFVMMQNNAGWDLRMIPIMAEPYGFGAVVIIWLIYPLVKKHKTGMIGAYISSALLATVVEFICAAVIVAFMGYNPYWDYSSINFNLFGFVCLRNSILFGLAGLYFIYSFYPWLSKLISRFSSKIANIVTIILVVWYAVSLICAFFFGFRLIL